MYWVLIVAHLKSIFDDSLTVLASKKGKTKPFYKKALLFSCYHSQVITRAIITYGISRHIYENINKADGTICME